MDTLIGKILDLEFLGSKNYYCNSNLFRAMKSAKNICVYFNVAFPAETLVEGACPSSFDTNIMYNNNDIIDAI